MTTKDKNLCEEPLADVLGGAFEPVIRMISYLSPDSHLPSLVHRLDLEPHRCSSCKTFGILIKTSDNFGKQ